MEEFDTLKFREKMRKPIFSYRRFYHGFNNNKKLHIIARSILDNAVGKSFKDAYNKFMKHSKYNKTFNSAKEIFMSYFDGSIGFNGKISGAYYIDENYNIQKRK